MIIWNPAGKEKPILIFGYYGTLIKTSWTRTDYILNIVYILNKVCKKVRT